MGSQCSCIGQSEGLITLDKNEIISVEEKPRLNEEPGQVRETCQSPDVQASNQNTHTTYSQFNL
jgi:hypothetical protein